MKFRNIVMIGIGAIGGVYGERICEAYGNNFMVIAGGERGKKLREQGITVNENTFYPNIVDPSETNIKADFIIFGVKNNGLKEAIEDSKNVIDDNTVILPILNGVSARDELLEVFPNNKILYGLSIGIDAVRVGTKIVSSDMGRIQFGNKENDLNNLSEEVAAAKIVFDASGVAYEICEDMPKTLWRKWLINMGCNQISALALSGYGGFWECENIHNITMKAMAEVAEVGKAMGVNIGDEELRFADEILRTFPAESKTSMQQDVEAERKTEVEYFSGTLINYGKQCGVPTPVNDVIYDLIKGREFMYLKK